jgi:hypothetical protein
MRVCIALGCLLVVTHNAIAQTPTEGWSGRVQCLIASRGEGYQDDQTHTWVLGGAPRVRNDFRDYPATWTVSGSGRRAPGAARASATGIGDSWTYDGSDATASITLWVPVGTATIRIAPGQRAVTAVNGIKGTAASAPFATNVSEWRFQYIDVVNGSARGTLSDSRTQTRNDLAGWRPPPGTTVTETCSWNLTKSGGGSAAGADVKNPTAAKSTGTAAAAAATGAARGAVTAAGAAAAGAPSRSGASDPSGPAGAAPAAGASNNAATAGDSTPPALSSDVTRHYKSVGLTPAPGTAVVIATLVDDAGAPLVGASVADIRLLDATSLPVGLGPFMFGAAGDIVDSSTLSTTASFNGRSRVAFLDVPAGKLTLTVIYSRDGKVITRSTEVVTTAGGVTTAQP